MALYFNPIFPKICNRKWVSFWHHNPFLDQEKEWCKILHFMYLIECEKKHKKRNSSKSNVNMNDIFS